MGHQKKIEPSKSKKNMLIPKYLLQNFEQKKSREKNFGHKGEHTFLKIFENLPL